jgi:hypothetical protein
VSDDRENSIRERYLAAIENEILHGELRLANARDQMDEQTPGRARSLAAISDLTLGELVAERDRIRAGGEFDEAAARRFLDSQR